MPGWLDGTVGYHIDHGKVFDGSPTGKETKGTFTFLSITIDIAAKHPSTSFSFANFWKSQRSLKGKVIKSA